VKLGTIAEKIADRLLPKGKRKAKKTDEYESSRTERREGDKTHTKTFISFKDMFKKAKEGRNTTITQRGRL